MEKRGQAALEYLMTYGWALIVIAIVVGVLVFIVSSPAGPNCSSSDPAKILMRSQALSSSNDATSANKILLQNITGGDITITGVSGDGGTTGFEVAGSTTVNTVGIAGTGMSISVTAGNNIDLSSVEYQTANEDILTNATFTMTYSDAFDLSRTVTITCNGSLPA